jgi:hypothetical protein
MVKAPPSSPPPGLAVEAVPADAEAEPAEEATLTTASHEVLFESAESAECDACGAPLPEDGEEDGYGIPGSGVYMWTRGDTVRLEKAPLCPACSSAIGMTALARWEIEEEEG